MNKWFPYILLLISIAGCCATAYISGMNRVIKKGYAQIPEITIQFDTVWKTDTVIDVRPVEKTKTVKETMYVPVHDTSVIRVNDTVFVALSREEKIYSNEDYSAQVSGVNPTLDWIQVYPKTAYVRVQEVDWKRWSIGVTAGPGVVWNGSLHGGIGLMAGIQYNF